MARMTLTLEEQLIYSGFHFSWSSFPFRLSPSFICCEEFLLGPEEIIPMRLVTILMPCSGKRAWRSSRCFLANTIQINQYVHLRYANCNMRDWSICNLRAGKWSALHAVSSKPPLSSIVSNAISLFSLHILMRYVAFVVAQLSLVAERSREDLSRSNVYANFQSDCKINNSFGDDSRLTLPM